MKDTLKLFCFPYAGGAASIFNTWKKYIHESLELRPVELAGRGSRIHEALYPSVAASVKDILDLIKDEIAETPYALFGHSMGAMIAYELAFEIRNQGLNEPKHLFFSGRAAPHIKIKEEKKYHLLDETDFKKKVLELGGTPPEFFQYPELLEVFLPLLRNDFMLAATDFSERPITPNTCDISVFVGKEDSMIKAPMDEWKLHTRGLCAIHYFNGGHFFLNHAIPPLVQLINTTLLGNRKILQGI